METNKILYESNINKSDDDEYEELYVHVDFDAKLMPDELLDPNVQVTILGGSTENPIFQINNKIFKGTYDWSVGTNIFFNECNDKSQSTALSQQIDNSYEVLPEKHYEYFTKTNKTLKMKRIFIENKDNLTQTNADDGDDCNNETDKQKYDDDEEDEYEDENGCQIDLHKLKIKKTYEDALNQFLKDGEAPPRKIEYFVTNLFDNDNNENQSKSTSNDQNEDDDSDSDIQNTENDGMIVDNDT